MNQSLGQEFRWELIEHLCWQISEDTSSLFMVRDWLEKLYSSVNPAFRLTIALILNVPHHVLGICDILKARLI